MTGINQDLLSLCRNQAREIGARLDPLDAIEATDWSISSGAFPDWR